MGSKFGGRIHNLGGTFCRDSERQAASQTDDPASAGPRRRCIDRLEWNIGASFPRPSTASKRCEPYEQSKFDHCDAASLKTRAAEKGQILLGRNRRSVIHVLIFVTSHRIFSHSLYSEEGKEGLM